MTTSKNQENIIDVPLDQALGTRYLSYALSTIMARSLPDVRDGLKPVQRRILYAMFDSGNTPDKPYRKSASGVGFVMMKYHPHGNDPIYEAMVRLAQDFSTRYPLIDGQGNFGSIDGDNAAAMRYTEARLSKIGAQLLEGIRENAVDFQNTYNNEDKEPLVLPTFFPNLLANGATGIAVGMATNIPPHNVGEICSALIHLSKKPETPVEELLKFMPGPDFPTGGMIVDDAMTLKNIYETGRGSLRVRARYDIEELKGGGYQIVIKDIPYQVQKGRLIEKMADLMFLKKLPLIGDIRDESTVDMRLVVIPKSRAVDPKILMESLYRSTDLESRFSYNMNVLSNGQLPRVMNLAELLSAFLAHCQVVVCRRTQFRLERIEERLEVLKGLQIAYLNLDEVIRIIRFEDEPKDTLIARFALTDLQAESILNMRLRALRKLEEIKIQTEIDALQIEHADLQKILNDEELQRVSVREGIKKIKDLFGGKSSAPSRRTSFGEAPDLGDISLEAMVEREPVVVICSDKGWIRTVKGTSVVPEEIKYKEGDQERFILPAETTDKLLMFGSNGRMYAIGVDKLPGGRGHGEPIRHLVDLPNDETILCLLLQKQGGESQQLLLYSTDGRGFLLNREDAIPQTRSGKQLLNVASPNKAMGCVPVEGDHVAIIGKNRKFLVFEVSEIPELTRGRGVILQRYQRGGVADLQIFKESNGFRWRDRGEEKRPSNWRLWIGKRAQVGRLPPTGFPKTNLFDN
jgi:topoisomerase-4 subunit A